MRTSIIIATFNGANRIIPLINSILPLLNEERELIIVNDGSQDDTADIVQSLIAGVNNAKIYSKPNSGRAATRNFGARLANGEYLLFLDDDIEISFNFIDRHEEIQLAYPNTWVTGTVRQKIEDIPHVDFLKFRQRLDYDAKGGKRNNIGLVEVGSFSTQQLCVRTSVFHDVGGFFQDLLDCEDFELSIRARDRDYVILHDTENAVFHRDFATIDRFIKRQEEYRLGRNALAERLPELGLRFPEIFYGNKKLTLTEKLARHVMRYNKFWKLLLQSQFRFGLPEPLRFKIYDTVISSTALLSPHLPSKPTK